MLTLLVALVALPVLTPDQVARIRGVSSPAISADGTSVAYVVSTPDPDTNRNKAEIWLGTRNGAKLRKVADGSAPAWQPRTGKLSYLTPAAQVATVDLQTGATETLTRHARPLLKFAWSPNGSHLAFLSLDPPLKPGLPIVIDRNNLPMYRLWVFDPTTRQEKLLTPGDYSAGGYDQWFPDTFSWSPDSRALAFSRRPHAKAGGHLYSDIAVVSVEGLVRTITAAEGMEGHPVWSPDGKSIAYLANHRYHWVVTSDLMLISPAGGQPRNLTTEFGESVKEFVFSADGSRLLFSAGAGVANRFYSADIRDGAVKALTTGDSVYAQLDLSSDGKTAAFLWQNSITPPDVYVAPLDTFERVRVSRANPELDDWKAPPAEIRRWKSFDGMEIEGILHRPATAQRAPLLVVPHGGPHGVMTNTFPGRETLLFLSRGWAVFRPNFRGSGNYGEPFLRANLGGWGVGDYFDIMTGVDALIASGVADPNRLAIAGASYGGYMTAWTISQTRRFKAAVAGCGITDVPSFIRTTDVPERFEDYLGKEPALYTRHSPMAYGERIQTPTLIWHGDQDARVPLMQSRHLYTQLLKNKVPVEFVVYPSEAHGLRRPGFERDLLTRQLAWLEKYVTAAAPF